MEFLLVVMGVALVVLFIYICFSASKNGRQDVHDYLNAVKDYEQSVFIKEYNDKKAKKKKKRK